MTLANFCELFPFLENHNQIKTQFERDIKQFCQHSGLQFKFSCPYISPQNGKAERHIKSINNIVRTLLAHSSMPLSFWDHALQMVTYLLNILPTKVLGYRSPMQVLYCRIP